MPVGPRLSWIGPCLAGHGPTSGHKVFVEGVTWVAMISESSKTYLHPRGWAGPEIVDFVGLNGPLLLQDPLEKVGLLSVRQPFYILVSV